MSYLVFNLSDKTQLAVVDGFSIQQASIVTQSSGRDDLPSLHNLGIYLGALQNLELSTCLHLEIINEIKSINSK